MDYNRTVPNPELELIRNRVLEECASRDDEWISKLITKTSRIHAGFLFEDIKTLQELCLYIGESQNKVTDPGWQSFGYHLGLNPSVLKVINYNNFNNEDPTCNTLLAFVQYEDATIGKIIRALWNLGRLDVISRIKNSINDLADVVLHLRCNQNCNINSGETSDYGSQEESKEKNTFSSGSDSDNADNGISNNSCEFNQQDQNIIKPHVLPPAPFIFQNIRASPKMTSLRIQQSLKKRNSSLNECHKNKGVFISKSTEPSYFNVTSSKSHFNFGSKPEGGQVSNLQNINDVSKSSQKYSKIVMLTFASDGEKYAKEISQVLRSKRDALKRIGVLILSEHIEKVMKDPYNFITTAFHQVDYVCPILTESYFNVIRRKEETSHLSDLHLDSRYVQLIYALMNKYYVSNACLNDKIRCIIPDELLSHIQYNLLLSIPIFSSWIKLSELDEMSVQLLKSRF